MLYGFLKYVAVGPLLHAIWRPWAEGVDNVPSKGPAILASNHLSFCDSFFMPVIVPRRVTFLAKSEYFTTPGIKGFFSRMFFSGVGQVPIDRADSRRVAGGAEHRSAGARTASCSASTRRAPAPRTVGSTAARPASRGCALESGALVVPCAMINTDIIQPTGPAYSRSCDLARASAFGEPLDFSPVRGLAGDRFVERSMTDEIMYALMQLSGQEYVDEYAAEVKKAEGNTRVRCAFGASHRARRAGPQSCATASDADRPADPAGRDLVSPIVRYFYDCEFIEDGQTIDLVSIGVVDENGREFYAVSTEFDPSRADRLGAPQRARQAALAGRPGVALAASASATTCCAFLHRAGRAESSCGPGWPHTTMSALVQLWGDMRAAAAADPALHHELRQRWEDAGAPPLPPAPADRHDALADARHNLARWRVLDRAPTRPTGACPRLGPRADEAPLRRARRIVSRRMPCASEC